jgi:hypothetical protein
MVAAENPAISRSLSGHRLEAIAHTAQRGDGLHVERLVDLRPDGSDMDVDHVAAQVRLAVPDFVQNGQSRHDLSHVRGQEVEDVELPGRQRDLRPAAVHPPRNRVDHEVTDLYGGLPGKTPPAIERTQAGQEFIEVERLGQVVVRPGVETTDPIANVTSSGQHQDGDGDTELVKPAGDTHAIHPGQHPVQQSDVERTVRQQSLEGRPAVVDDIHRPSGFGQRFIENRGQPGVILRHENPHRRHASPTFVKPR